MAQLSSIIYSMMRDLVLAQHEANLYSSSLKEAYVKYGRLETYSLPTIALGEIDLDLHYGVGEIDENVEQWEVNYAELRDRLSGIVNSTVRVATEAVVDSISEAEYCDSAKGKALKEFVRSMQAQSNFSTLVSRKFLRVLHSNLSRLLTEEGAIDNAYLLSSALQTIKEEILASDDFTPLVSNESGVELREQILSTIRERLEAILPRTTKDVSCKRLRRVPSMSVVINSEELSKMPEESIHSFRIKIKPQSVNMQIAEPENVTI